MSLVTISDSPNIGIIAGCAAAGAFIVGVGLVIGAAFIVRRKRHKKVKLIAPDFNKFMFWPGKYFHYLYVTF